MAKSPGSKKSAPSRPTVDVGVTIGALKLDNPTILASGVLGLDCDTMYRAAAGGAGAVTLKSLTREPRTGHNNPILVECEAGFMNAVGYANAGIDAGVTEFSSWDNRVPLIGSVVGADAEEFAFLASRLASTPVAAIEIVLSCPHTPGYGLMAGQGTPEATAAITKAVRRVTGKPVIVKISPSVPGIGEIAKAAESEGADAVNMGNTLGPGMKIDIDRARPVLAFKMGGLSGPAIKPITVRSVFDLYAAVRIPVIATGGITTGADAVEMFMAGATAIGIGTGIYYRGIGIFGYVVSEIREWLSVHGYRSIADIKGAAHEE